MKRLLFAAIFGGALVFSGVQANAQTHHYVKTHPQERTMTRPDAPSSKHVWVGTEWSWSNGHYAEKPGHWTLPPRGHKTWTDGHWEKGDRGDYWVKGSWH